MGKVFPIGTQAKKPEEVVLDLTPEQEKRLKEGEAAYLEFLRTGKLSAPPRFDGTCFVSPQAMEIAKRLPDVLEPLEFMNRISAEFFK